MASYMESIMSTQMSRARNKGLRQVGSDFATTRGFYFFTRPSEAKNMYKNATTILLLVIPSGLIALATLQPQIDLTSQNLKGGGGAL